MASILKVNEIQHTNATSAMTIDSSGRILTPARPAFSVQCNRSSAMSAGNSFSQSHASTIVTLNQGSHFKTSGTNDGKFVAPIAGLYYFDFQGMTADSSNQNSSGTTRMHFTKNGDAEGDRVGRWHYAHHSSNDHAPFSAHEILLLAANDAIGVRVSHRYFYSTSNYGGNPTFSGYLIG